MKIKLALALLFFSSLSFASEYLYKGRVEYIRIEKAGRGVGKRTLSHPYTFTDEGMRGILSSLRFSKKMLITKDIEERNLFSARSVEFLIPYLVRGFAKLKEKEQIHFAYIEQDPKSLIRSDRLTAATLFVEEGMLHIRFGKIFAKLLGDYQRKGQEHLLDDARSLGLSLEYAPGVEPSGEDDKEVLINLAYDFTKTPPTLASAEKEKKGKEVKKEAPKEIKKQTVEPSKNPRERLKEVEKLKQEELITDEEYRQKRRDILKEL
ncbi:MAG: hypothetical protein Q7S98_03050 [Deltaproteobacteria bacterium]|nr:hypothetical protein [Deltaproteobacteria bacterium]